MTNELQLREVSLFNVKQLVSSSTGIWIQIRWFQYPHFFHFLPYAVLNEYDLCVWGLGRERGLQLIMVITRAQTDFFLSQGLIKMAALSSHGINMTRVEMCLLEGGYLCVIPASWPTHAGRQELTQSSNKVPDRKWLVCSSELSGQETGLPGEQS